MTPTEANIDLVRGNTYSAKFTFLQSDNETAHDLTAATLVFRAVHNGAEVLRRDTSAGITVPTPANGEAFLTLTPAQTRALPQGAVTAYELEMRQGGAETTVFYGKIDARLGNNDDA
jgi:hypothetical protein